MSSRYSQMTFDSIRGLVDPSSCGQPKVGTSPLGLSSRKLYVLTGKLSKLPWPNIPRFFAVRVDFNIFIRNLLLFQGDPGSLDERTKPPRIQGNWFVLLMF